MAVDSAFHASRFLKMTIPDDATVARYAGFEKLSGDKPSHEAFRLEVKDGVLEDHLSVNWVEYYSCQQMKRIREDMSAYLTLGSQGVIAILDVGKIRQANALFGSGLEIKYSARPKSASHTGVFGYRNDNDFIPAMLARLVSRLEPTRDP